MVKDIFRALRRAAVFVAIASLAGCGAPKPPTDMVVTLLLRTNETDPIADGKLTLIFDGVETAVVTDGKGHATFHVKATVDRRYHWESIGFTPFSWPVMSDHLAFQAALDHSVRIGTEVHHYPVLYKFDIFRDPGGDCLNPGARVFGPDADGHFSIDLDDPNNKGIPINGKTLYAPNNGYRVIGSFGDPATERPLKLDLDVVREHWALAETAPQP